MSLLSQAHLVYNIQYLVRGAFFLVFEAESDQRDFEKKHSILKFLVNTPLIDFSSFFPPHESLLGPPVYYF